MATLLNHAIPAPQAINKTLTDHSPQPTLILELIPQSTVVASHPAPYPRLVSDIVSVPMVSVPT